MENQRILSEEKELRELLRGHRFRRLNNIHPKIFDSITSTQNFLQAEIEPKEEGDLVVTRIQTEGKGREGRAWISDRGGLWMTLLLKPPRPQIIEDLQLISTRSIVNALEKFGLSGCSVKLPNDVYFSGKKIAGVLVDAQIQGAESIVFLGIGIDVNNDPSKNKAISEIATSFYAETRHILDLNSLTCQLLVNLDELYSEAIQSS